MKLFCRCSGLDKNVKSFSSAVVPLADSLKRSSDVAVKRAIACALERLSRDQYNCFLIHQHDALKVSDFLNSSLKGKRLGYEPKLFSTDNVISYGVCCSITNFVLEGPHSSYADLHREKVNV